MLAHYKGTLKGLKKKLKAVTKAKDINKELASRIAKSQAVVKQQEAKITELNTDTKALAAQSDSTANNIEKLRKTVAERKHLLIVARSSSERLTRLATELKKKAKTKAAPLEVKTSNHGSSTSSTQKAVKKINAAILKAGTGAKTKMLQAVKKEAGADARITASHEAMENSKLDPDVPGMNKALFKVGKLLSDLGLSGGKKGKDSKTAKPKKVVAMTEDQLVEQVDQDEATNTGLDRALDKAGGALTELHLRSVDTDNVHKAELLAHVAHTLFQKAMETGKATDKNTARVAMKKAISFRSMLA